ncbi:MAG: hypothetical protein H7Y17_15900 [Chlorobia bacterium]|nr:hypothetical protein [Fimbriimonadaceae bacterium]
MLVISSFFVLVVLLATNNGLALVNVAVGSAIILIANMLFVGAGMLAPGLVEQGKIVFPLNITLPLVYSGWGAVVTYLSWRIGSPLEPTMEVFRRFADLFERSDMIWFPVVQFAVMTVAVVTNSKAPAESVDST